MHRSTFKMSPGRSGAVGSQLPCTGSGTKDAPFLITKSFLKKILFVFRERGREGETHQRVVASCTAAAGDLARNPGLCPDWESNQRPFGSQAGAQSTEPHRPGPTTFYHKTISMSFCDITTSHSSSPRDTLSDVFKLKL